MKQDLSNLIAEQMQKTLSSPEHQSIFGLDKAAQTTTEDDMHSAKDSSKDSSDEDTHSAKDSSKDSSKEDTHSAKDSNDHFDTSGSGKVEMSKEDKSKYASDESDEVELALDTALGNLLSASSAFDAAGFEKSASLTLELANFVVEAKKKADKKKKSKKSDKKDSKKDSKKSDSKKSDKKDSKKDSKKSSK